jgi:hypothetical protein
MRTMDHDTDGRQYKEAASVDDEHAIETHMYALCEHAAETHGILMLCLIRQSKYTNRDSDHKFCY